MKRRLIPTPIRIPTSKANTKQAINVMKPNTRSLSVKKSVTNEPLKWKQYNYSIKKNNVSQGEVNGTIKSAS